MSELKTLKDMENECFSCEGFCNELIGDSDMNDTIIANCVNASKLRQEAIKHIRKLEVKDTNFEEVIKIVYLINWIKKFFNISDEDLQ